MKRKIQVAWVIALWLIAALTDGKSSAPKIPKTWDEAALVDWATPFAGLNQRPTHISAKEYYSLPVENLRTYPAYFPGREPEGYWEMLQRVGPQPLIEPEKLKTEADWVEAGRRVFEEADDIHLRTYDPKFIAEVRDRASFEEARARSSPDGILFGTRWAPTKQGLALTFANCSFCHTRNLPDGTRIPGAPFRTIVPRWPETFKQGGALPKTSSRLEILVVREIISHSARSSGSSFFRWFASHLWSSSPLSFSSSGA